MPRENDYQVNFRADKDCFVYLHTIEGGYTNYLIGLINADRARRNEKTYIDSRRRELKKQLDELDHIEKTIAEAPVRGKEVLQRWMKTFYESKTNEIDEAGALSWIRFRVLPDLKKAGVLDLQPNKILPMFLKGVIP